jgi:hypothetical protein
MRKGTLLALGGIGALTHSIVWHQMQTETTQEKPLLPAYGEVPDRAAAGTDDLVVHSCVVVAGEVRIHATVTNTSDDVVLLGGVDYELLDDSGTTIEDSADHPLFTSGVTLVGVGRSVRLVDSNPAPANAAECRPIGVASSAIAESDGEANLLADVELSACAGDSAVLTARNPGTKSAAVSFVVEYFDGDGFSLGQTTFNGSVPAGDAAAPGPGISIDVGQPHPASTVSGCEVVLATLDAD